MENMLDLDHMSIDKCQIVGSHPANDMIRERDADSCIKVSLMDQRSRSIMTFNLVDDATIRRSSSQSNQIPSLDVDSADAKMGNIRASRAAEDKVDFAQLFKEGYCNESEFQSHKISTGLTDEIDSSGDTHEEKLEEEGWIGGMFDFSEEGRNLE